MTSRKKLVKITLNQILPDLSGISADFHERLGYEFPNTLWLNPNAKHLVVSGHLYRTPKF